MSHQPPIHVLAVAFASLIAGSAAMPVAACPFCEPMAPTFSERIAAGDVALVGALVSAPADNAAATAAKGPVAKSVFRVERVFRGEAILEGKSEVALLYYGQAPPGSLFLLVATRENGVLWSVPEPLTSRGVEYLAASRDLPKTGPERLVFFQQYLEDQDRSLDGDAYNEFAQASYEVILAMKDKLQHETLIARIRDPQVEDNRRRLYLTLLGVCGSADDVPLLEEMLASRSGKSPSGLDALVACYLTLKGPDGVPLIEDRFLKNHDAEFSDTYAAITALRFIAEQTDAVPRTRVCQAFYHMLDRPDLADLVIVDLARWEDWSVMDRLAELFRRADEKASWVRQPIARYLMECPLPEAKQHLEELKRVDADSIQRAGSVLALLAGRSRGAKNDIRAGDGDADKRSDGGGPEAPSQNGKTADDDGKSAGDEEKPQPGADERDGEPRKDNHEKKEKRPPLGYLTILGIPFAAGVVLLAVLWFVLAGVGGRPRK